MEPQRFQPLSTAEAVLRYAGDFIPSWAGAIAIDLMSAVLVLIPCVVHAGIRREGVPEASAATMSAAQLMTALHLVRDLQVAGAPRRAAREPEPTAPEPAPGLDENVTPLATVRVKKD